MRNAFVLSFASLLATLATGCTAELIPNTDVPDTAQNREAIRFVESYRHAVERRNVAEILALVSPRFLDDNGTPTTEDDRDYDRLRAELAAAMERLLDVRYEMKYRRVTYRGDRILVDYTYTSSFKVATPDGERWESRVSDNRIELVRENGELRILSGI